MAEPSTQWREVVRPDEQERHERQAARFVELQTRLSGPSGAGRALYRRQVAALRATLTVAPELPDHARQGLFAVPETYDAWVRLSNGGLGGGPGGGGPGGADREPDVRGFAIKVLGLSGVAALGGEAVSQDFVLGNQDRFSSPTSEDFTRLVTAGAGSRGRLLLAMLREPGLFSRRRALSRAVRAPFTGFATEDFFSAAPIAFGPYAVRVKLAATAARADPPVDDDWAADLFARLAEGPIGFDFQVQFFTDEPRTPIEDASVPWDASYLTVGRLAIFRQRPDDGFAQEVEQAVFDPWNALIQHRPLGEVMRARKVVYRAGQQHRDAR